MKLVWLGLRAGELFAEYEIEHRYSVDPRGVRCGAERRRYAVCARSGCSKARSLRGHTRSRDDVDQRLCLAKSQKRRSQLAFRTMPPTSSRSHWFPPTWTAANATPSFATTRPASSRAHPGFLTQDDESSGIIPMSDILAEGLYLLDVQAHYNAGMWSSSRVASSSACISLRGAKRNSKRGR
jgi:hypothetical protein